MKSYDKKALELHGEYARLNFPEDAPDCTEWALIDIFNMYEKYESFEKILEHFDIKRKIK